MRAVGLTDLSPPVLAGERGFDLDKGTAPGPENCSEPPTAKPASMVIIQAPVSVDQPAARRWLQRLSPASPFASARTACLAGLGIAASLFCLGLTSYVRAMLDGTLASDDSHLSTRAYVGVVVTVAVCCLMLGYCYFKAWNTRQHASLECLLLIALVIHLCAFPAMPLTGDDLFVNLANGRLLQAGFNPYLNTPADLGVDDFNSLVPEIWFRWITPYGPINTWLSRLTVSAGGLWPSIWAFKSAMLLAAVAMVMLAYGFCRNCLPPERRTRSFILLAWNPLLAWELTAQSHNDGPMLVLATAFVWAAFAKREWLSSGLLITAFYAKFAVAPVLGLHLCYRARKSLWRAAVTVVAMFAAGVGLYYPFWYGPKTLTNSLIEARSEHWHVVNSFISFACEWADRYSPALKLDVFSVWSLVCQISFLGLAAWYAWRAKTVTRVIRDSLMFLLLFEAIGKGWFVPWYATWLLPLAMAESDVRLQRVVAVYSLLVLLLYIPSNIGVPIAHGTVVLMVWQFLRSKQADQAQPDTSTAGWPRIELLSSAQAA
jgi:hypothetical protein